MKWIRSKFAIKYNFLFISRTFFILLVLISIYSCRKDSIDDAVSSTNEKVTFSNLSYGIDSQNVMDVFLPKNPTSETKAVILIHGGGWIAGDKTELVSIASSLADSGIIAVSINYRYADASKGIDFNSILSDIDKSIVYLVNNSQKFGCAFSEITLFGASAGGHLALLYAINNRNIKNVISLAGPTDLNDKALLAESSMNYLIYNLIGNNDSSMRDAASPIMQIPPTTHIFQNNFNKDLTVFLYHGKLDTLIPYQQSVRFFDRIKSLNPNSKLELIDNCGHGFSIEIIMNVIDDIEWLVKNPKS